MKELDFLEFILNFFLTVSEFIVGLVSQSKCTVPHVPEILWGVMTPFE